MLKNTKDAKLYNLLLLLNTNPGLVFSLGAKILDLLPGIDELFSPNTDFTKLGLTAAEITKLQNPDWRSVEQDLVWAEQELHHIITIEDVDYPRLLKEISHPPLLLFVIGDLQLLKSPQLAMVGSRKPTPMGIETAQNFAAAFGHFGLVITSGFATGIDIASHQGAMRGGGKTIAVMGTGLNYLYPVDNHAVAEKIIEAHGALVSEFTLRSKAVAWHFPLRNRIISGLSLGTLVVEAGMRSGSLITARLAGEQGREVFAIPGSIYNQTSRGCHYLLHQGAKLVEQPRDVLEELPIFITSRTKQISKLNNSQIKNKLDCKHRKLLDCVGFEITTMDTLATRINLPVALVSVILLELEMLGLVKNVMGGYIRIANPAIYY